VLISTLVGCPWTSEGGNLFEILSVEFELSFEPMKVRFLEDNSPRRQEELGSEGINRLIFFNGGTEPPFGLEEEGLDFSISFDKEIMLLLGLEGDGLDISIFFDREVPPLSDLEEEGIGFLAFSFGETRQLFDMEEDGGGFLAFFSRETDSSFNLEEIFLFFCEETTKLFGLNKAGICSLIYFCREPRTLTGLKVEGLAFLISPCRETLLLFNLEDEVRATSFGRRTTLVWLRPSKGVCWLSRIAATPSPLLLELLYPFVP
jgi:hypothetical protein